MWRWRSGISKFWTGMTRQGKDIISGLLTVEEADTLTALASVAEIWSKIARFAAGIGSRPNVEKIMKSTG